MSALRASNNSVRSSSPEGSIFDDDNHHDDNTTNPLAPEGYIAPQVENKPLSNSDFRKILMTPRGAGTPLSGSLSHNPVRPVLKKSEDGFKPPPPRKNKQQPKYRDRAEERRQGVNKDYETTDAELSAYQSSSTQVLGDQEVSAHKLDIERSKYLGGDLEHTHLVKGLDYALLAKVKSEIEAKDKDGTVSIEKLGGKSLTTVPKTQKKNERKESDANLVVPSSIVTPFAKSIYAAAFSSAPQPKLNKLFQSGRMAFLFDLESEFSTHSIPTTLIRSNEEIEKEAGLASSGKKSTSSKFDDENPLEVVERILLEKISKIMESSRLEKEKKKKKSASETRKGGATSTSKVANNNNNNNNNNIEEDDIFADAGTDYTITAPQKKEDAKNDQKTEEESRYFRTKDKHEDLPSLPKPSENPMQGPSLGPSIPSNNTADYEEYPDTDAQYTSSTKAGDQGMVKFDGYKELETTGDDDEEEVDTDMSLLEKRKAIKEEMKLIREVEEEEKKRSKKKGGGKPVDEKAKAAEKRESKFNTQYQKISSLIGDNVVKPIQSPSTPKAKIEPATPSRRKMLQISDVDPKRKRTDE